MLQKRTKVVFLIFALFVFTQTKHNKSKQDTFYKHGAVASDSGVCSDIGVNAMKDKGTAVDAAIATLFCLGLIHPHSSGIGGGGFMLIYQRSKKKATFLDFRETAPAGSTYDNMFVNKTDDTVQLQGKLSIGVPGELMATYTAWKRYGKLPWKRLIQPTIDLAINGYKIDEPLSVVLKEFQQNLTQEKGLREMFFHKNGSTRSQGDTIKDPIFAKTLTEISQNPMSFYNGSIAREIVKDIKARGGIITEEDLKTFTVKEREVLKSTIHNGDTLYTTTAPSSGSTLIMILNILKGYNISPDALSSANIVKTWHRMVEAFKFSFAYQPYLGDPDFDSSVDKNIKLQINSTYAEELRQKIWDNATHDTTYYGGFYRSQQDHGTSHLSVLGPSGDAVSVTTTIGYYFGAGIRTYSSGIIYNNHMSCYSLPNIPTPYQPIPSTANLLAPGKRTVSTACPAIIVGKSGSVRMVVGASGSLKIPTCVSSVIMKKLWFGLSLRDSISTSRVHHQLFPNKLAFEINGKFRVQQSVVDDLKGLGHVPMGDKKYCAVQGVYRDNAGRIYAMSDPRKTGVAAGF